MDINWAPVLDTVHRISDRRIGASGAYRTEGEFRELKVPVFQPNPDDSKETNIRKFLRDQLSLRYPETRFEVRFEAPREPLAWLDAGATEPREVCGLLVLTWWPKPPESDFENLKRLQALNRQQARKS